MRHEDVVSEDIPYVRHGDETFLARVYRPTNSEDRMPGVIDVHPGAWHDMDRTAGRLYDEALARLGFVVAAVDFRQAPRFGHPAGSADVATAVRWMRSSAGALGVDPGLIGLVGSSSGGHLALLAACRPDGEEHLGWPLRWRTSERVRPDLSGT